MSTEPVFKITPAVQSYDWGKLGSSSKVAQIAAAGSVSGFKLDTTKPYAEVGSMIYLNRTA
jgi:mannose-6-phosphate isomerase